MSRSLNPDPLAALAHDVRNCAAALSISAEAMGRSADPDARRCAVRLLAGLDRIALVCAEALRPAPAPEPGGVDLGALLAEVTDLADAAAPGPVDLLVEILPPGGARADLPRAALFRILFNLVQNAVSAVARGGGSEVRISLVRCADRLIADIADDGPGLPPDAAAILRPGVVRPPRTPRGLGLRIAASLAAELGGRIELRENGPTGAALRVTLPLGRGRARAPRQRLAAPEPAL